MKFEEFRHGVTISGDFVRWDHHSIETVHFKSQELFYGGEYYDYLLLGLKSGQELPIIVPHEHDPFEYIHWVLGALPLFERAERHPSFKKPKFALEDADILRLREDGTLPLDPPGDGEPGE